MLRTPFDLRQFLAPGGAVPDLEVVVDARHDDVAAELRVVDQCRREHHPALLVQLGLRRPGEEEPLHPPPFLAERIERREPRVDEVAPVLARVREEAAVHTARHDDPIRKVRPDPGREGEAVLVIDRVLVFAEKHSAVSVLSTFPPDKPHRPTCPLRSPPQRDISRRNAGSLYASVSGPAWPRRPQGTAAPQRAASSTASSIGRSAATP